jgi:hypothetical protein
LLAEPVDPAADATPPEPAPDAAVSIVEGPAFAFCLRLQPSATTVSSNKKQNRQPT